MMASYGNEETIASCRADLTHLHSGCTRTVSMQTQKALWGLGVKGKVGAVLLLK